MRSPASPQQATATHVPATPRRADPGPAVEAQGSFPEMVMHLQRTIGNRAVGRWLGGLTGPGPPGSGQPPSPRPAAQGPDSTTLVGPPNDSFEREADHVADGVMSGRGVFRPTLSTAPSPSRVQRQCARCEDEQRKADASGSVGGATIQRKCAKCDEEERIQRVESGGGKGMAPVVGPPIAARIQQLKSGGQPLSDVERGFFEPRLGTDLGDVRIHDGGVANETAVALNAHAFTTGKHVVFAPGKYAPGTDEGRRLLAHELAHTIQQTRTPGTIGAAQSSALETEADHAAGRVLRGEPRRPLTSAPLAVQRQQAAPDPETPAMGIIVWGFRQRNVYPTEDVIREGLLKFGLVDATELAESKATRSSDGWTIAHPKFGVIAKVDITAQQGAGGTVYTGSPVGYRPPKGTGKGGGGQTPEATPKSDKPKTDQPEARTPPISPEGARARLDALPANIKALLGGSGTFKPGDYPQLLRIAEKLTTLDAKDLELYKLIAKDLTANLDDFENSIDRFVQFKRQIEEAAAKEKAAAANKEPTLEQKIQETYKDFDSSKFGALTPDQKEQQARELAGKQRDIQLKHMATHPGETLAGMVEGVVRVDKAAEAIAEDVREAADGNNSSYGRLAGGVGALTKYIAAVAGIVFIALLFVPGVNLVELAAAGLAVAVVTVALAVTESELRIKAAAQATTAQQFQKETGKAAQAQALAVSTVALIGLSLALKLVAKTPLPGRLQNVGNALKIARNGLLEASGAAGAWRSVKATLLERLRAAKQGLPEALAEQSKAYAVLAQKVEAMTPEQLIDRLAAGDPALTELGVTAEQAQGIKALAATPEGKGVPAKLREQFLKGLNDAPVQVGEKFSKFNADVDQAIKDVEAAQTAEQVSDAIKTAEPAYSATEQGKQAAQDLQSQIKKAALEEKQPGDAKVAPPAPAKTPAQAFGEIAEFRKQEGLPDYKQSPGSTGTVAQAEVNGKPYYGRNSTAKGYSLTVEFRRNLFKLLKSKGKVKGLDNLGQAQFLSHAEAEALIRAHEALGKLPEEVTIYVDRPTCPNCQSYLGDLAGEYGVKKLIIYYQNQASAPLVIMSP